MVNNLKLWTAAIVTVVIGITLLTLSSQLTGHNNYQNWQLVQGIFGNVSIVEGPGYYGRYFSTIYTYPRTLEAFYSAHTNEGNKDDESVKVTFNDGGTAQVSCYVKIALPQDEEHRKLLHKDFLGNPDAIKPAIRSHLINCIKSSGPMMSASENQSSRKSEFNQIVEEQLINGLFRMKRSEVELGDLTETVDAGVDDKGNKIVKERKAKVLATEIVVGADGKAIIDYKSPLDRYGITVLQFSITDIDYDTKTLEQFAAKKESYLNAEKSKAQRQEEIQQRLMVEEKGRRQVAEIEAQQNQEKTKAVIQAELNQEVAVVKKQQAVTEAQQKVEVAGQNQKEAETLKSIAKIKVDTAELDKQATIAAAEAKQKSIDLGGGISEKDRVLAEMKMNRDIGVAQAIKDIKTPMVIMGNGDDKSGGSMTEKLINITMLRNMGILDQPTQTHVESKK